jgi:formylglycine-generating enzyme required for sulfatase activity
MVAIIILILLLWAGIFLVNSLLAIPQPVVTPIRALPSVQIKATDTPTIRPSLFPLFTSTLALPPTETPTLSPSPVPLATLSPTVQFTATRSSSPVSCTTVGQTWIRPSDQMVMMCIPAGGFQMGMDKCTFAGCEKEVNGGNVDLPAYWIDHIEVTNGMFQKFVLATGYVTGAEKSSASEVYGILTPVTGANWRFPQGPGSSITAKANHPVVQMNWYSANAYCKWTGGRLPSEAEWEKSARGNDGRLWPWGNVLPSDQLMNAADKNVPEPQSRTDQDDGFRYTSPAGAFAAGQSPFGLMDMAGNAWEWTRSVYQDYPYDPNDGREIQTEPGPNDRPVLRGGCWFDDYGSLRSTMRYGGLPQRSTDGTGFRCVYP